jgi:UDP-3-O-[3-hydroxymyristoyl] N-acetylglucosamine deacetylase/3-hydroxyacyl-[acyl-carrier-protein] dehydratase
MKQRTLKSDFTVSGKGLHTGIVITAHFCPAAENTGIRIRRVDLPGQPTFEALADYVTQPRRGTVLENGNWRVSTVEHILSALYGLGLTNVLIEVNAPEVPILDGSARPIVEEILRVGITEQAAEAKEWIVTEPVHFDNGKGSTMTISPADRCEVLVDVDYPSPILHEQHAEILDLSDYAEQISKARTFCFLREIEWLLRLGLIKGGDLNNALVIYDKPISQRVLDKMTDKLHQPHLDASKLGYLSPLIYENEPARHKLLDLMGDLTLLGVRIRGRIEARCPGHGFNTSCAKQIRKLNTEYSNYDK